MINHLRTLFLNKSLASVSSSLGEGSVPWYIDPHFNEIVVPKGLKAMESALVGGDPDDLASRISRVNAAMSIVSMADLSVYLSFFDKRSTVVDESVDSIRSLYARMRDSVTDLEKNVMSAYTSSPGLFLPTNDKTTDASLSELKSITDVSYEMAVRSGAALIAYAMQLELIRKGFRNG